MSRELLLAPRPAKIERVEIPDFGTFYVRRMTGNQRDKFDADQFAAQKGADAGTVNLENYRSRLLVRCLCDESGTLLMSPDDASQLGEQDITIIAALYDAAAKLNGMDAASVAVVEKK